LIGDSETMRNEFKRKSAIALGIGLICGVFLLETSFAHQVMPNPASPYVWSLLGAVGVIALALSVYWRVKARSAPD
jgi:hypothetical protein